MDCPAQAANASSSCMWVTESAVCGGAVGSASALGGEPHARRRWAYAVSSRAVAGGVKPDAVAGCVSHGSSSSRGGSLLAEHYTRNLGKAFTVADKLKAAGFRPNVVKSGPNYVVYIARADLLRLTERDGEIKKAIALYLAEKAKDGTPRQREIAEKILKRNPLFRVQPLEVCILNWL